MKYRPVDLADLRVKLSQMSERIVSGLKDRSRYKVNGRVYIPDAVPIIGGEGKSLLYVAGEGFERYHASLGRYKFSDQYPLWIRYDELPEPIVHREVPSSPVKRIGIDISGDLVGFYISILPELCEPGDDPDTYGEAAFADAYFLENMHERVNLGRFVAESKLQADHSLLQDVDSPALLRERLKDVTREDRVVADARNIAERYMLDPDLTEKVFRWMINETLDVEVAYLQRMNAATKRWALQ